MNSKLRDPNLWINDPFRLFDVLFFKRNECHNSVNKVNKTATTLIIICVLLSISYRKWPIIFYGFIFSFIMTAMILSDDGYEEDEGAYQQGEVTAPTPPASPTQSQSQPQPPVTTNNTPQPPTSPDLDDPSQIIPTSMQIDGDGDDTAQTDENGDDDQQVAVNLKTTNNPYGNRNICNFEKAVSRGLPLPNKWGPDTILGLQNQKPRFMPDINSVLEERSFYTVPDPTGMAIPVWFPESNGLGDEDAYGARDSFNDKMLTVNAFDLDRLYGLQSPTNTPPASPSPSPPLI